MSKSLAAERIAREDADTNLALARRSVEEFFTKVSENVLMKRQDAAQIRDLRSLRKEFLEAALDYYQRLLARRSTDRSLSADQAEAYERVGRINGEIGSKDAALDYYRKALALRTSLASARPSDEGLRRNLASTRRAVGDLLDELGRVNEALEQLDQALADMQRLAKTDRSGDTLDELARLINAKAIVLQRAGRLAMLSSSSNAAEESCESWPTGERPPATP